MQEQRLNSEELAQRLRVKVSTIRLWAMHGLPYIPAGRLRFYDLATVEAWIQERDRIRLSRKKARAHVAAALLSSPMPENPLSWLDWTEHGIS